MTPPRGGGTHDDGADPEFRVLVHCARARLDGGRAEALREDAIRVRDWDRVLTLAGRHGLLPLVARHLSDPEPAIAPADVLHRLREIGASVARANLAGLAELLRILDALESAGISAVPVKGPIQAIRSYGDVALRSFEDLDVLVPRAEVLGALEALEGVGYEPHAGEGWRPGIAEHVVASGNEVPMLRRDGGGMVLDLHWRLFPARFRTSLEDTGLFDRLDTFDVGARRVRCLGGEDRLLYGVHHGFRHRWSRLEWVAGTAETLRGDGPDWDAALDRAGRLGMRRALGTSLALVRRLLDAPVPERVSNALAGDTSRELARRFEHELATGPPPKLRGWRSAAFEIRGLDRRLDRIHLVVRLSATPTPADWRSVPLGRFAAPAYYGVRLARLGLRKAASAARALIGRGEDGRDR